jgi:hypothetical protein
MFRHDTYGEDNISIHTQGDFTTVDFGYATLLLTRKCVSTLERQLAIVNHARRDYERTHQAASLGVTVPQMIESDRADAETVRMLTAELEAAS